MLSLYNSLTRKVENFEPLKAPNVGMYTCGPTVYNYAHIGNFRTYVTADFLVRTLLVNKYKVKYIMNLTDVGHLTGDNVGDADTGEDRMEKAANIEGKSAWDIAKFYTKAFMEDFQRLNLVVPYLFTQATDHIEEQIELIKKLEKKGFAYTTTDGIYFDTEKFPAYGKLSDLDKIKEGARVEINPEKKNPRDFALWKFSPEDSKRQMEWESPWGVGFPGWHIECSAMGMKYLGESFDIHAGGIDLKETHHPNEIAQSEAVTGKQFVKYWVHSAFMLIDGKRMSKSLGNNYTVDQLERHGADPMALRYLFMQTHYRKELNFTFESLEAAQTALSRLREEITTWSKPTNKLNMGVAVLEQQFMDAINDDLNMPKALGIVWELMKSNNPSNIKAASLFRMDEVLGLDLFDYKQEHQKEIAVPAEVQELISQREALRKQRRFHAADALRAQIRKLGYEVEDNGDSVKITKA
jgi:cysteinyl-tRNA synthetase